MFRNYSVAAERLILRKTISERANEQLLSRHGKECSGLTVTKRIYARAMTLWFPASAGGQRYRYN